MKASFRESLLWSCVSLCVVFAVVFGAMLDNRNLISLADTARPLAVLGLVAVGLNLVLMALVPTLGRVFPAALLAAFAYGRIKHGLADFSASGVLLHTVGCFQYRWSSIWCCGALTADECCSMRLSPGRRSPPSPA